jgi:hypothetical protein
MTKHMSGMSSVGKFIKWCAARDNIVPTLSVDYTRMCPMDGDEEI